MMLVRKQIVTQVEFLCCTVHGAVEELQVAPEVDHEATEQTEERILIQGKILPLSAIPARRHRY